MFWESYGQNQIFEAMVLFEYVGRKGNPRYSKSTEKSSLPYYGKIFEKGKYYKVMFS